jgi:hypothetical protein
VIGFAGRRRTSARPVAACCTKGCEAGAPYTPILNVALRGREHVSRIELPMRVCPEHRSTFARSFLTPERRAKMEVSLSERGREPPDWSRTTVEFEAP